MKESFERRTFRSNLDLLLTGEDSSAEESYQVLYEYACAEELKNTLAVLEYGRQVVGDNAGRWNFRRAPEGRMGWWLHGLTMARLLLDLAPPLSRDETDVMLAAAVGHVLRELLSLQDPEQELCEMFPLDRRVWRAVMIVTGDSGSSEEEQQHYYDQVCSDKLALLVKLAGRGDVVSRLSRLPLDASVRYARETRRYFLPMCIRAREEYPELGGIIGILMEKMRALVGVADVLDLRFAAMEKELEMEILDLQQDNARIRGILTRMGDNGRKQ